MSDCRECGQHVEWARTERGKNMPLDPTPTDDPTTGTALVHRVGAKLHVRIEGMYSEPIGEGEWRLVPHFATCPARGRPIKPEPEPEPEPEPPARPVDDELIENWEEFKARGWVLLDLRERGLAGELAAVVFGDGEFVHSGLGQAQEQSMVVAQRLVSFLLSKGQ